MKNNLTDDFNPQCIKAANYIKNILKFYNDLSFHEKDLSTMEF